MWCDFWSARKGEVQFMMLSPEGATPLKLDGFSGVEDLTRKRNSCFNFGASLMPISICQFNDMMINSLTRISGYGNRWSRCRNQRTHGPCCNLRNGTDTQARQICGRVDFHHCSILSFRPLGTTHRCKWQLALRRSALRPLGSHWLLPDSILLLPSPASQLHRPFPPGNPRANRLRRRLLQHRRHAPLHVRHAMGRLHGTSPLPFLLPFPFPITSPLSNPNPPTVPLDLRARPRPALHRRLFHNALHNLGIQVRQIPHVPRTPQTSPPHPHPHPNNNLHLRRKLLQRNHVLAHPSLQRLRPRPRRRRHPRAARRLLHPHRGLRSPLAPLRLPRP